MDSRRFSVGEGRTNVSAVEHIPENEAEGTVVFCHGFGSDKEGSYERRCDFMAENDFRAVRFDFRGNNESALDFEEADLSTRIEDLQRVLSEVADGKTMVYGSSFGGLVALHTAVLTEMVDFLALRAPVTYMEALDDIRDTIEDEGVYQHIPGKKIGKEFVRDLENYSTEKIIEELETPVLIMHGNEDSVVPIELSKKFFRRINCRKKFKEFGGQGHRFDEEADFQALNSAKEWFEEVSGEGS